MPMERRPNRVRRLALYRAVLLSVLSVLSGLSGLFSLAHAETRATPIEPGGYARVAGVSLQLDARESQWVHERPLLTAGVVPNVLVPFDMIGLGNQYEGISADYLQAVATILGVGLRIKSYPTKEQAIEALVGGQIDILPSTGKAPQGDRLASSAPYFTARNVQVVAPDRSVDRMSEVGVGYVPGHVSPEALRRAYPNATFQTFGNVFLGLSAAAARKVDVFVGNGTSVAYLIDQYQLLSLRPAAFDEGENASFHFAMKAADTVGLRLVDRALAVIPARVRNDVKVRWSPTVEPMDTVDRVSLSEDERRWSAAHPTIRYAAVEDRMPFVFMDKPGHFNGLSVEVLDLISSKTGLAFVPVELRGDAASATHAQGTVDMLPVVTHGVAAPPGMSLSDAYFQGYWVVVGRVNDPDLLRPEDLEGKRIAYLPPNGVVEKIKDRVPSVRLMPVDSIAASYDEVAAGKADLTVGNINTASYVIQHRYEDRLKVAGAINDAPVDIAFAVRSDYPELLSIINKSLESLSPEEMRRVRSNWMFLHHPVTDWSQYYRRAYAGGAILLACLGAFYLWNRSLRKEMRRTLAVKDRLRDELAFRHAMLEGMPHAVGVRDREMRLLMCNSAFTRFFNVPADEMLGKRLADAPLTGVRAELVEATERSFQRVLESGEASGEDVDVYLNGKTSKVFRWAAPISLREGEPPTALVTGGIDVTQRYQLLDEVQAARAKAETADRAKSNFLATMSHEIRSPMNAIMGMLELLLRRSRLGAQDRQSVELAHESAKTLLGLIDDILDISKIEAGGLEIVPRPAQLQLVVTEVARVFESLARQRGLSIDVQIDPAISPWHEADALRFRQIVNNLVSNAIKYTDSGGVHLRLRLGSQSGDVETVIFEVQDTGIGIAADDVSNLFQPFFQAESAGPRVIGGTGLGLPIVQRLCKSMRGDIAVESTPGEGTRVWVTLTFQVVSPPETESVSATPVREESLRRQENSRYSILVVDDHSANRLLLQQQLGYLGFRSSTAENGAVGLAMWHEDVFDLVITDCSMPELDGYQLTAAIRADERERKLPRCPVVGCTAHAQAEDRQRALGVGMDECLIKPVGIDALFDALKRHLELGEQHGAPLETSRPVRRKSFDLRALSIFSGCDDSAIPMLLGTLLRSNIGDLHELQSLARSGALADAAAYAHKIKGAARMVEASDVVRACEIVEKAARPGSGIDMLAAVDTLSAELARLNEAISEEIESSKA